MANPNPVPRLENLRPWKPGQSGNDQGAKPSIFRTLKRLMKEDPEMSEDKAARIMWSHYAEGNSAAIKLMADHLDGPVINKVEIDDVSNLSIEERLKRLDQLANLGRTRRDGSSADDNPEEGA